MGRNISVPIQCHCVHETLDCIEGDKKVACVNWNCVGVIIEIEHASHKLPMLVFILASNLSVDNLIVGDEPVRAIPEGHLEGGAILWSNGLESVYECTEMYTSEQLQTHAVSKSIKIFVSLVLH